MDKKSRYFYGFQIFTLAFVYDSNPNLAELNPELKAFIKKLVGENI